MNRLGAFAAAFVSGFVFLSFEVLWVRVFSFASQSSPRVFGNLLGIYLLGIAISSFVCRRWMGASRQWLSGLLALLFTVSAMACYMVIPLTAWFSTLSYKGWAWGFAAVFAASLSFGGILPLLVQWTLRDEEGAGALTGGLYAGNIAGSTVGALVTGYLLLDLFPAGRISTLMSLACLVPGLGYAWASSRSGGGLWKRALWAPLGVALCIGLTSGVVHLHLYEKLKYKPRSRHLPPFAQVIENRNGVVVVSRNGKVFGDGAYDGVLSTSLSRRTNPEIFSAYLQFLVHPGAREILTIGLGSGAWSQVLVNGPKVEQVTAVEINPAYLEVVKGSPEMAGLLENPKFHAVIDDGRRWLRRNPLCTFDLIVMNTTFHWRNHATALLSEEFLQEVKAHLAPGGVICLNGTGSRSVDKTVAEQFKYVRKYSVYLLASDSPFELDSERFADLLVRYTINGRPVVDASNPRDGRLLDRVRELKLGVHRDQLLARSKGRPTVTDDNMATEFGKGRR